MQKSDTRCERKQECSSSKADELKVEVSAEWLRIWRYERGIRQGKVKIKTGVEPNTALHLHVGFLLQS